MEALKLTHEMDIFSDEYISNLYQMDYKTRNQIFAKQFTNLEVIDVPEHGVPQIGKSNFQNPPGWKNTDNLPPYTEGYSFEDYMKLVPHFKDPYANNVVEHDGMFVVRDDMIPGNLGSKARYAAALMQEVDAKYLFYAMVPQGQAGKVLASVAKKYNKIVVLIAPWRKEPTEGHIEAMKHGAIMLYYHTGGMAGARKRCRAFIHDQLGGKGMYVPAGVKHPIVTAGFAASVNKIYNEVKPDVIFCAASTMVMAHGIMVGTPNSCEIHAVQVAGNSASKKWPGRAIIHFHDQPFNEPVKKEFSPPYESIPEYDAKIWKYAKEYQALNPDKKILVWNVAGTHDRDHVEDAI